MTVLILLGYLMVGIGLARIAFIRLLGDAYRYVNNDPDEDEWTKPFMRAVWAAVGMLLAWPVIGVFCLIFAPTPVERLDKRRQELETLEAELEALGKKYQLDWKINTEGR